MLIRSILASVAGAALLTPLAVLASSEAQLDMSSPAVQTAIAAQNSVTSNLMQNPYILGTAVGLNDDGTTNVRIFVDREAKNVVEIVDSLPRQIGAVKTQVEVIEKFRSAVGQAPIPDSVEGAPHTQKQTPPIQLGTSGGWTYDLANGFCCGGTSGALVSIGGVQHVLSNYHVYEADIVPGGNGRTAQTGDPIIQPGLIDVGCVASGAQSIATLVKKSSLPGSNVDCAVAKVVTGMVDTQGRILEIGTLGGYSAIWLARALPRDGKLISLELEEKHAKVARANLERAGVAERAEVRVGPALETLKKLVAEKVAPFDFVFIDADKVGYPDYFTWSLKLTRPGSMIIADNVVRDGAIADANSSDAAVKAVRKMNEMMSNESRVDATILQTVGSKGYDGWAVAMVKG